MLEIINIKAAVIATVALFVLAFAWFGPLFGKKWMKLNGISKKDAEKSMVTPMIKELIGTFIMISVIAYLLSAMQINEIKDAANLGAILGIGFILTNEYAKVNWAKGSTELFLINAGFGLLSTVTGAVVYTLFI